MDKLVWGLTITALDNGETLLTSPVVDQAALHGVLKKVRDVGMPLLSVNRVTPGQAGASDVNETHQHGSTNWYAWTWPRPEGGVFTSAGSGLSHSLQREQEETKRKARTGSEDARVAGYVSDTTPTT